ncbi:MAG: hypothetical protein E4H01_05330 [Lysobacterales bacterium]|nr:MAG: hypothetical protein E4H01_05330 [Xanthomonadales bacterium]
MSQKHERQNVNVFWIPALDEQEKRAIKALWAGEASASQQRLGMQVIIDKYSMADFLPYQPGSFDETAMLNGRSFVGKSIRRTIKEPTTE